MDTAYSKIININTLDDVLCHLKQTKDKHKISVWLDWDENIINSSNDTLIEPEVTKELFRHMLDNKIFFSIITGRFYETACDEKRRNIFDMQANIIGTIYPVLSKLGVDTGRFSTDLHKQSIYKIYNKYGRCIGILYMGIFFSHEKGSTIDNYLKQTKLDLPIKIFVDDYEPYLIEATTSVPDLVTFRRHVPYQ